MKWTTWYSKSFFFFGWFKNWIDKIFVTKIYKTKTQSCNQYWTQSNQRLNNFLQLHGEYHTFESLNVKCSKYNVKPKALIIAMLLILVSNLIIQISFLIHVWVFQNIKRQFVLPWLIHKIIIIMMMMVSTL